MKDEEDSKVPGWTIVLAALILAIGVGWLMRKPPGEQKPDTEIEEPIPAVGDAATRPDEAPDEPANPDGADQVVAGDTADLHPAERDDFEPGEPAYEESQFDQSENPDGNYSEGDAAVPPPE